MSVTTQTPDTAAPPRPVTLRDLRHRAMAGRKFAMLTCYDATTARWLFRGGLDVMLVGDTAGSMILGHDDTIHAPLEFMLQLTAAVKRGAPRAFVMGDMPFMSYHADDAEAVRNAGRFMTEGLADAVKLEVDRRFVDLVAKLDRASVPVVAHIGWRPQRTARTGVPVVAGRTLGSIDEMVGLAKELVDAGAAMLLIEQATAEAAAAVIEAVGIQSDGGGRRSKVEGRRSEDGRETAGGNPSASADAAAKASGASGASGGGVPVIGCGAGPDCHGHVVVLHDWLGMTDWQPSFAPPAAAVGRNLAELARRWVDHVEGGEYLKDGGPYSMSKV